MQSDMRTGNTSFLTRSTIMKPVHKRFVSSSRPRAGVIQLCMYQAYMHGRPSSNSLDPHSRSLCSLSSHFVATLLCPATTTIVDSNLETAMAVSRLMDVIYTIGALQVAVGE